MLHHSKIIGTHRGADLLVVELFGYLHDSCRENDGRDRLHGERGVQLARSLNTRSYELNPMQIDSLCFAIEKHSNRDVLEDVTI